MEGRRGASRTAFPRGSVGSRGGAPWVTWRRTGDGRLGDDAERRGLHSYAGAWDRGGPAWVSGSSEWGWRTRPTRSVGDGFPTRERERVLLPSSSDWVFFIAALDFFLRAGGGILRVVGLVRPGRDDCAGFAVDHLVRPRNSSFFKQLIQPLCRSFLKEGQLSVVLNLYQRFPIQ